MTQGSLNFGESFLVGTRIKDEIQHFVIDNCYSVREARQAVEDHARGYGLVARPILAVVNGGKKDKPVPALYRHTSAPDQPAA